MRQRLQRITVTFYISNIPGNLRRYWQSEKLDCQALYKKEDLRQACEDKNMIRNGVLNLMRRMKLMDSTMDPDIHPFPTVTKRPIHATSSIIFEDQQKQSFEHEEASDSTDSIATTSSAQVSHETFSDSKIEEEDNEEEEEEELVDSDVGCRLFKSWHTCVRHEKCTWRHLPNLEYCDLDVDPPVDPNKIPKEIRHDSLYDFNPNKPIGDNPKYFMYQASGGWNNQRILLESAMVICKLLNRTCIAPPASPHSNYFVNYNKIPASAVVSMSQVLNFEELNKVIPVVTIPQGMTFKTFLDNEIFKTPRKYSVRTIFRDFTKYKPGAMKTWAENDIIRLFGNEQADVLYFSNQTMWGSLEWKGLLYGWKERKLVHTHVMPANHIKKIARNIAEELGEYNSVHIRRGDKVGEANFKQVSHDASWWASRMVKESPNTKVYIATDEAQRNYFDVFEKDYHLSVYFWESLPNFETLVKPYLNYFPKRMAQDILGMIEQLVCTYSVLFLGSGYSTFTTYVLRLRKYRETLAADTTFENRLLGLPENIRNVKSNCDPLKSLTHSKPC